jgi:hypothetical protein
MAETLLSPGVLSRENDSTVTAAAPAPIGASIIGPTVLGQPYIPRRVTTFSEYLTYFGGSFISSSTTGAGNQYTYFTSTAAFNYFQNGGNSLWVTRVVSGNFAPATSSFITTGSAGPTSGQSVFVLQTLSWGANQNSTSSLDASGSLASGSNVNLRWEIVNANTASGTFNLLIRRGNDNNNVKNVLETWGPISLDPTQINYIEKVIGNQTFSTSSDNLYINTTGNYPNKSNYVTVRQVNFTTPNYFDNLGIAKTQFTGSIPANGSGSFGTAIGNLTNGGDLYNQSISNTNTQGLAATAYSTAITLMSNQDEYAYNVIATPGLCYAAATHQTQLKTLINNTQNRGDAIAVIDLELYNSTVSAASNTANSIDSSYAASYWPWVQTVDPITGEFTWVPASTMIPAVYAFNDTTAASWFAPAGLNRGSMTTVIKAEKKLTQADRNTLYQNKVNPVATFPGSGVVVFGQKTLQTQPSALDRVNVRRLLITLKDRINEISNTLVFEQNTIATRNSFLSQVNPYLESVQQQQGLYAFKVVMDDSNNTPEAIDRNQLIGQIYLQPTKTAEFIILDFNILPTGATFPA